MTASRFMDVTLNEFDLTISANSLTEMTMRNTDDEPILINGIAHSLHVWVKWNEHLERWTVRDTALRRSKEQFRPPTDNARRKAWRVATEITETYIEGNDDLIDAGFRFNLEYQIERLEKEISDLQVDLESKRAALLSVRQELSS